MTQTRQKIAVVTGGNRGIGFEICRQLARERADVVLTSRDPAKGEAAVRKLGEEGLVLRHCPLDVTDAAAIERLRAFLERETGTVHILVNNAGVLLDRKGSGALDLDLPTLQTTMETNLYGPFLLCRTLIPMMRKQGYGRIVNLSSGLGQLAGMGRGTPAYRMSKAALNALTATLAAELTGTNILVNAVCPGWVRTDMGGRGAARSVAEGADTAVRVALLPDGGPSGRLFRDRKPIPW